MARQPRGSKRPERVAEPADDDEPKQIGVRLKPSTHRAWKAWVAHFGGDYEDSLEFLLKQFPPGGKWIEEYKAGKLKPNS